MVVRHTTRAEVAPAGHSQVRRTVGPSRSTHNDRMAPCRTSTTHGAPIAASSPSTVTGSSFWRFADVSNFARSEFRPAEAPRTGMP